jgi:polysaccharide deacetylase 2 family uncharacterized protein YibQ
VSRRGRKKKPAPKPGIGTAVLVYAAILVLLGIGTGALLAARLTATQRTSEASRGSGAPRAPDASRPPASTSSPRLAPTAAPTPRRAATAVPNEPPTLEPNATPPQEADAARVALVFDDAGGSLDDLDEIIAIGRSVTVAVLPELQHSTEVAERARSAGLEVILHLPIASTDKERRLGPGAVTTDMSDDAIAATVDADFRSVSGAIGANNHMGSAGTADRRVMRAVLRAVKARGGFFLDSRTTTGTVVEEVAAEIGVKTARRAIFIDNDENEEAIRQQVRRMIQMAKARGAIVAIGHAQRITPRVIAQMLPEIDRHGVALVPLSTLVAATRGRHVGANP